MIFVPHVNLEFSHFIFLNSETHLVHSQTVNHDENAGMPTVINKWSHQIPQVLQALIQTIVT